MLDDPNSMKQDTLNACMFAYVNGKHSIIIPYIILAWKLLCIHRINAVQKKKRTNEWEKSQL